MPSKMTLDQLKEALSLEAATVQFAAEVGAAMDDFWLSIIDEDQTLPLSDEERVLAIGKWIRRSSQREVAADAALEAGLRERRKMLLQNQTAAVVLRAKLMHLRQHTEGTYGPGQAFILLGLGPGITEDPLELAIVGRNVVNELLSPGFAFPEPLLRSTPADPAELAADILPSLEIVEATRDAVDPEKRGAQRALKHKRRAAEGHTVALGRGARYLEALFFLGGEDFLAERLRLSSHIAAAEARRKRQEEEKKQDGKPEEDAPVEESPGSGEEAAAEAGSDKAS